MPLWNDDAELFDLMKRELFTAVVGDVLDSAGMTLQFLPRQIQPLRDDMIVAGRAMPVLGADCRVSAASEQGHRQPFGLLFRALDDLKPNEVYLCTGGTPSFATWGGLMSTRAIRLGAAGAVLNGCSRDTREILALDFPTFSLGRYAQDQGARGRVIDFRCPISFHNGVTVEPGDIVFGDVDGVVIVPRDSAAEIIAAALEKVRGEDRVRQAIRAGMGAQEAYDKYGIL